MGRENRPVYIFTSKLFAKLALRLPLLSSLQTLFYLCFVFVFIKKIFCLFSGTTYVTLVFRYEFQSEQLTITWDHVTTCYVSDTMNVALIGSLVALLCLWHDVAADKPEHFGNRRWTLDWSNYCCIAFLLLRLLLLLLKGWGEGVWCNTWLLSNCDHVARIKLQQSQEQRYRVLLVRMMFHCAPSALLCYVPCLFNSRRQPKNYSSLVF